MTKTQAQICDERHGFTNALQLVIACKCDGCDGELHSDGPNTLGTLEFLVCTTCRCAYVISTTKEKELRR